MFPIIYRYICHMGHMDHRDMQTHIMLRMVMVVQMWMLALGMMMLLKMATYEPWTM